MNNNKNSMNNPQLIQNAAEIKPWRKVVDMTLIILCWLTISPLMSVVNKYETYFKRKMMIWLTIFSPFTWTICSCIFLLIGIPIICTFFPSAESMMRSFPELNFTLNHTNVWGPLLLVSYFLPLYAFCVGVLFVSMAFTGWSYREASVYICEYFEPWFCVAAAIFIMICIIVNMKKMNVKGRLWSVIPMIFEVCLAWHNAAIYFQRVETYKGMSINEIFSYVVDTLIELGKATGTDYVTANMIVYIFPLIAILLVGYLAWIIYTLNKKDVNHR